MRISSSLHRTFLAISMLNALVSAIHLVPPMMDHFSWQRALLSITRVFHGAIEFMAFVISTFSSSPRVSMWVGLALLVPLFIYGLRGLWITGFNGKLFVTLFIVINIAIGISAVWADGLLVNAPSSCETILRNGRTVRVIEYREIGWQADVNYFLAQLQEDKSTWVQAAYVEVVDREKLNSIVDPCDDIFVIFPDYQ